MFKKRILFLNYSLINAARSFCLIDTGYKPKCRLELFDTKPFYSTLHRYEIGIKKCVLFIILIVLTDVEIYFPDALSYRKNITLLF